MIVVYHEKGDVVKIDRGNSQEIVCHKNIIKELFVLAEKYPDEIIVWCDVKVKDYLNLNDIPGLMHHKKMLLSFKPDNQNYINDYLGFIDHASILKINKKVAFFSWQATSTVGVTSSLVLIALKKTKVNFDDSFDYFLNSFAKRAMPKGLFCYSEPKLLMNFNQEEMEIGSDFELFRFVKQHYDFKWVVILFLNFLLYRKKIAFLPFLKALFYTRRNLSEDILQTIDVASNKCVSETDTIDVIIPTIGREKYVYDVLNDLRKQTHLPINVIIVEQNPLEKSVSGLDFINTEEWPFTIDHVFTHRSGACNARNMALSKVKSEWIFMNDDDNRFEPKLIEDTFENIKKYGVEALSTAYPQTHEKINYTAIHQTTIFGSGNSFIKKKHLSKVKFDSRYEFGYGEDFDFGMQLRNAGIDVVYFPFPAITHLKAPMGGFRIKPIFEWSNEPIPPIPSPTVMLNNLRYKTTEQLQGYKTIYFYKTLKKKISWNYFIKYKTLQLHWEKSLLWANRIMSRNFL